MSGLGEWDDDAPVYDLGNAPVADVDEEPDEPVGPPDVGRKVAAALDGLDVASIAGSLVAATVTAEIHRQVQKEVAPIVTEAVAAVLTPDRLDALREAATSAAEAELNPPAEAEASAEDAPVLYYGSVDEFVREFVCPIFRRNVGEEGRADYRWSARWWSRPRRSPGWKPCGGPGSTCAWTPPPGRRCGCVTTPTITWAC